MTLVEVLAALSVLAVGIVAMITLLPLAGFGIREGAHRSTAVFMAADRLEQVRRMVGTAASQDDPLGPGPIALPDEPTMAPPYEAFARSVRVEECGLALGCSGTRMPGIRQVTVAVTYPISDAHAVAPTARGAVVLTTYIGPR